ncbi:hypothetical protein TPHA_0D01120 [Tetrapisispora phaffii CBS 4417]|uniref:PHD-type domain-containing protein n=1 Tax=Tetrapisispora phaffii (strain ATCC 24235 / CBS 4417 / NBRC 1672 / NRRL Y-8282 / UCD 70-5) TaxID=1071381 RepID=G8BSD2_TETPH|nr:hypothetical protein TPHA_0D01120 [Tetrapisispora phaffii CBS 4417]CCE62753.1 hypothetical protein TPHA_0D01120 [Tetrapisispora phaffii CBS 4417]
MDYVPLPSWCKAYSDVKLDKETNEELFCICKKPDNGDLMVGCDGCDDWFHFSCVKIPLQYRELIAAFYCPYCQAGITGKSVEQPWGNHPIPKTMWKRKCRVESCFSPCKESSKYCSEAHGQEYIKNLVNRVQLMQTNGTVLDKEVVLTQLVELSENDREKFKAYGTEGFIYQDVNKELNPELHSSLIENDSQLKDLESQISQIKEKTLPKIEKKIQILDEYIQWFKEVINAISGLGGSEQNQDNGTGASKKKKKSSKTPNTVKRICGYTSDLTNHPTLEEFVAAYNPEEKYNFDICSNQRCQKHHDWAKMFGERYEQEKRSIEAFNERLALLIQMRKNNYIFNITREH